MKKGFTLIEILVVIAIIAVLMGVAIGGFSGATKAAERARCQELVSNVATAMTAYFQDNGVWPPVLRDRGSVDGLLDQNAAIVLAPHRGNSGARGYLSLSVTRDGAGVATQLKGYDRFGVVSPWAVAVIKRLGTGATLSSPVKGGGTIQDHIFHFAVDLDGDGIIEGASVGGESIDVRANVMVWCAGQDGVIEPYSRGLNSDDVYSWTVGQTKDVK